MKKLILLLPLLAIATSIQAANLLPTDDQVKNALYASPKIGAADARKSSLNSKADAIASGSQEFVVRGTRQSRNVTNIPVATTYQEYWAGIEKPIRFWGKGGVDEKISDATKTFAGIEFADTMHETSKDLLATWFNYLKALQSRIVAEKNSQLGDQIGRIAQVRYKVGDVARLDAQLATAEQGRLKAFLELAKAHEGASGEAVTQRYPGIALIKNFKWEAIPNLQTKKEILRQQYLERSHELKLVKSDAERFDLQAKRTSLDRLPDPTIGIYTANEFGGAERISGLSLSFPISGSARFSNASAAASEAEVARQRVLETEQRISVEFERLWSQMMSRKVAAETLLDSAKSQNDAAQAAEKAYVLGEGTIADLIAARKAANENQLSADLMRLDALESYYRMRLDLHEIWDFD
ncbi:TolC family protein [Polynucleobacter sp. MWH-UH25E]|uniref:TolC family protein n=1 Tax=Polynucleobacter sp. MWH-UH25E TaxID=1855616 RepID=UPI001BFE81A0|nr:TolC family protein [Polynucleobacter sp. MWH-UH25E]QWD62025.1 TolC family protein [Polynucleobacter sp. MWH-UH25E]